ncbi:hypothetical protein [Nocardioides ferulae]|uniref:hypothetical protein n=1 Tax=Nocardioides ferulae TaxID=2340821 RepID=UPI000F86A824|nr:hypothetical protein [Nocardioides ferulae]
MHDPHTPGLVAALVDSGLLAPNQRQLAADVIDRELGGSRSSLPAAGGLRRTLAEVAGFAGAGLLIAAVFVFVAQQWPELSVATRAALLAATSLLLCGAGLGVGITGGGIRRLRTDASTLRRHLAGLLLTGSAGAAAGAVLVLSIHLVERDGPLEERGYLIGMSASATLLLGSLAGYLIAPTAFGQLAAAWSVFLLSGFVLEGLGWHEIAGTQGVVLLVVGAAWLVITERGWWRERQIGQAVGCVLTLIGAQLTMELAAWLGYSLTFAVAVAAFAAYARGHAAAYLVLGVVGTTLVAPEALLDWTDGSIGAAGVLLVAGASLLGASLVALGVHRSRTDASPGRPGDPARTHRPPQEE